MTDRDTFAAAALTGLMQFRIDAATPGAYVKSTAAIAANAYDIADAMLRERERTNHDAVPEARASPSESSVPLGNGGGCGGIDKPVTLPAMGTGDIPVSRTRGRVGTILSEAEIDALEYVVEEGRIASMDDYGILRSLLVRVRPEWEAADSVSPFAKPETDSPQPVATPQTHATPSEGSVQESCTLTDEEREAIEWFAEVRKPLDSLDGGEYVATLRKLLGRTNHDAVPQAKARTDADSLEAIVRGEVDSPQPFAAAYAVYLNGEYDSSYGPDAIDEAMEIAADCNGEIVPLYRLPDEQVELNAAMQGRDAKAVIWQVDQYCRGVLKHGEPSAETRRHLEEIRETLRERPGLLDD
jgi:hypothetical protein